MTNNVLFEIGVEELPARFIDHAEKQLYDKTAQWLGENRIVFNQIESFSTPRRLAVVITGIANEQSSLVEDIRGPKLVIAQDKDGAWTKAAIGFAKGQKKTPDDLFIRKIDDIDYVFIEKKHEKIASIDLMNSFSEVIKAIEFPQTMKWGENNTRFARPIRWLVALFNEQIIPMSFANINATNTTYGHRFLSGEIIIEDPANYERLLLNNYVIVNPKKREEMIKSQFEQLESQHQFHIIEDKALLAEVRNLVEFPTAFIGKFSQSYLSLPEQVLTTTMKIHQRYFPVINNDEDLLPYFIGVRNGTDDHIDNVARGNEKVLAARLSDAHFFYEEDKQESIEFFNEKLNNVVFQEKIGTYAEKVNRIKQVSRFISEQLNLNNEDSTNINRVAEICKFDLVTNMIDEFPELQGIMGEIYAKEFNENEQVAKAIKEHYLPIHTNGELPEDKYGAIISIADKIDTIVGCFTANLIPTGSQDPYALRRQAIGLLKILEHNDWPLSFDQLLKYTLSLYKEPNNEVEQQLNKFMQERMKFILREEEIEYDVINAVLHGSFDFVVELSEKAHLLTKMKDEKDFESVHEAFIRVINLSEKAIKGNQYDESLIESESEEALYLQFKDVSTKINNTTNLTLAEQLLVISSLGTYVHEFLDNNLVMSKDETIKQNRLTLLDEMAELILQFADFTVLD